MLPERRDFGDEPEREAALDELALLALVGAQQPLRRALYQGSW
jgi:hypothetical protein